MSRNVSVSRCRAMAEAVSSCPSPRSAVLHPGPVSVRLLIHTAANRMLFAPCVFLQSYYHPAHGACDSPFMTYINSYMFRHQGVIKGVSRSAFVGFVRYATALGRAFHLVSRFTSHQRHIY